MDYDEFTKRHAEAIGTPRKIVDGLQLKQPVTVDVPAEFGSVRDYASHLQVLARAAGKRLQYVAQDNNKLVICFVSPFGEEITN